MNSVQSDTARLTLDRRRWATEATDTLRLAWPMALTQLGQIAMMTTDLAMLGRLGDTVVAAASLAHAVLFMAFVLGMGLVSAVAPLAAQAYGARSPRVMRRSVRVGIWVAIIAGVPLTIGLAWAHDILVALGQQPEPAAIAARYLQGLSWTLIPAWIFIALRGFMGAVNRPGPALWITIAAVPANAALAYGLIYGVFGMPRLDVLGAGVATALVNVGMCVAAVLVATLRRPFKKYRVLGRLWRPDWHLMKQLLVIGLPMSGSFILEMGLFAAAALLMGRLGTVELAAHQMAVQTAAILFMVPFGISMAATVRVGHAVGRRDAPAARKAGFVALGLGAVFMAVMTLLIVAGRHTIPLWYLGTAAAPAGETVALTATLLLVAASFFIADGLQTVAAGALRGLSDTRIPLLFAAFSFWAIGFASATVLAFQLRMGAVGIWVGLSLGLTVYAVLLVWRFDLLTRRHYLPPVVE